MTDFSFQMQLPAGTDAVFCLAVVGRVSKIVAGGARIIDVDEGADQDGTYVTITARTSEPGAFWNAVRSQQDFAQARMIVVCEGSDGWNDYLLLHHFDAHEELDALEDR